MNEIADGIIVETEFEGVNVGAIATDDFLLCIDAPTFPRDARIWSMQMERLFPGRTRYLVLTDFHGDRILNSRWLQAPLICHKETACKLNAYDKRYPQKLLDSLAQRNAEEARTLSNSPVEKATISFDCRLTFQLETFDVLMEYRPGPTGGSLWVIVPDRGVLFSGDSVVCDAHPPMANILSQTWLYTLEALRRYEAEDIRVVPGRGSITDPSASTVMTQLIKSMRYRVKELVQNQEPADHLNDLSGQFLSIFPAEGEPDSWLREDITLGLERIYNEYLEEHPVS